MRFTLSLHREAPESEAAATRELSSQAEAAQFLSDALGRISNGIAPGEEREVGVTVRVVG